MNKLDEIANETKFKEVKELCRILKKITQNEDSRQVIEEKGSEYERLRRESND